MVEDIYQKAWQRLLKEIQKKTGWGNVELQKLMLDCLVNPEPPEYKIGMDTPKSERRM